MCLSSKDSLRRIFCRRRNALSPEMREVYSRRLCSIALQLEEIVSAEHILLYCAVEAEANLATLIEELMNQGKSLYLPKISGGRIRCIRFDRNTLFAEGAYHIPEPQDGLEVLPDALDAVLVPGIAFTRDGDRLGHGGGYYDRLLRETNAKRIGVCFSCQLAERLPQDPWDIAMDLVLSESQAFRV